LITHEAQGKQKVIHGLMKVLEHLKADHEVLYGSHEAPEPTAVDLASGKMTRGIDGNTFIGKKFSNIDV